MTCRAPSGYRMISAVQPTAIQNLYNNKPEIPDMATLVESRYLDRKGNLLKSRLELSIAQMLDFVNKDYRYAVPVAIGGRTVTVDFQTDDGYIEVIDTDDDIKKYKELKAAMPDQKMMAIGHPRYAAKLKELDELVFYDQADPQTGSIFLEDPSFTFDYAHILPLVEKCSILHGHTSAVLVELAGQMKDNLLVDFGQAKAIIKRAIDALDHKFFINRRYLRDQDDGHYMVAFDGPKGRFELQVPKDTAYLLDGEATVETLSGELIKILAPELPKNVEAVGVYIYEGYNKGSHIISNIAQRECRPE